MDDAQLEVSTREHFDYEVRMLAYSSGWCAGHLGEPGNEFNVHLESALVHARTLHDFLVNKVGGKADVAVRDFGVPAFSAPVDSDELKRINGQIAHLRSRRVDKRGHYLFDVTANAVIGIAAFVASLPADRQLWFENSSKIIRSAIESNRELASMLNAS